MIRAAGNLDAVKVDSKAFNDFVSDVDRRLRDDFGVEALRRSLSASAKSLAKKAAPTVKPQPVRMDYRPARWHYQLPPRPSPIRHLYGAPASKACCRSFWCTHLNATTYVWLPAAKARYSQPAASVSSNRIELNRCLIGTGFPVVDQSMMDKYLTI